MNNLFDALEKCLQAIERGADLESTLSGYPDLADELRPILKASFQARGMAVSEPSLEVMRRGRAKLLQRAAEIRETKVAKVAAPRRMIPVFQRLAISLTLAAIFLLSGNGLVRASTTALPGENLYPVKRTWEDMRLLFVFNQKSREHLEIEFENERLHEVNELLTEGRDETIQFAGIWLDVNGVYYASGIRVVVLDTTKLPQSALQNGAAVIVTGHTNAAGFVEAEEIVLLPAGTTVPEGQPVEVESEDSVSPEPASGGHDENDNSNSNEDNGNGNENSNDDHGNDNTNENSNDSSDDHSNDNSNDNGNDNSGDSKDNNDNSNEDNSGHGGGDDNSSSEEDSGGSGSSGGGGGD